MRYQIRKLCQFLYFYCFSERNRWGACGKQQFQPWYMSGYNDEIIPETKKHETVTEDRYLANSKSKEVCIILSSNAV